MYASNAAMMMLDPARSTPRIPARNNRAPTTTSRLIRSAAYRNINSSVGLIHANYFHPVHNRTHHVCGDRLCAYGKRTPPGRSHVGLGGHDPASTSPRGIVALAVHLAILRRRTGPGPRTPHPGRTRRRPGLPALPPGAEPA